MNVDTDGVTDAMERDTVRSATKVLLGVAALAFTLWLVSLLPGIDGLVPAPFTFEAVVEAVLTVAVVALLLYAAPRLAALARGVLDGPSEVVENVASVVRWLVVLLAVLVAHGGLADLAVPLLGGLAWVYDVAFLLVALPAVAAVALRLYRTLDPGADLVADAVAGSGDSRESDDPDGS